MIPKRIIPPPIPSTAEIEEVMKAARIKVKVSIFLPP
jgi:hypothetical protein